MDTGCSPEAIREIEVDLEKLAKFTIGNLRDKNLWRIFNTLINAHGKRVKLNDLRFGAICSMPVIVKVTEKHPDLLLDAVVSIISSARDHCLIAKGIPLTTVVSESDREKSMHAQCLLSELLAAGHTAGTTPLSGKSPLQT